MSRDPSEVVVPRPCIAAAVQHDYVIGYPLFAAMTVWGNPREAMFCRLPLPRLSALGGAVGLSLATIDGTLVHREIPDHVGDPFEPGATFALGARQSRRILLELSSLVPTERWRAGSFNLELVYADGMHHTWSQAGRLEARLPDAAQCAELETLHAEVEEAGGWGAWCHLEAADPTTLRGPFDARDPMIYLRVLRYLMHGPDELARIPVQLLDPLPGLFSPEALLLRAELAWARHPMPELDGLAAEIRQNQPDMTWWLDEILGGRSSIAFARSRHAP
jgi:hypothetical protein